MKISPSSIGRRGFMYGLDMQSQGLRHMTEEWQIVFMIVM